MLSPRPDSSIGQHHPANRKVFTRLFLFFSVFLFAVLVANKPQPASATTAILGVNILGVDSCAAPTVPQMQAFWTNTPYYFWGVYIGGDERTCSQPNLTSSWVSSVTNGPNQHWELSPWWVGPQAPCNSGSFTYVFSYNTSTAYSQGENEAISAYDAVVLLGMGSDTPVAYDLEAFDTSNSSCVAAAQAFINGWTHQLSVAPPQTSGVYGSTCASDLTAYASISLPPEYIFGANYDGNSDTSVMACVPSGYWGNSQRLKQYENTHSETWNNQSLNVDSDSSNGPVYSYPPSSS